MIQQPPHSQHSIDTGRDYVEQVQGDVYSGEVHIHHASQPLPTRPSVLHNLPQPDFGHFIGREAERAKIIRILRPYPHSQHSIVTIDGIGWIGKSALALEIAHHYLRHFDGFSGNDRFEAIIWTSAKQNVLTAEGIRARRQVLHTLQDIYSAIAVALQREDITRATLEEQDAVVTRALTQQRTLLIVDNLETVGDEAVLDFLRELPAPTKATRHRIDVAYPVRLTGMPWEDGRDLIAQECEEKAVTLDEDLARWLYERTGGVSLALVWSVAQMGFGYSPQAVLNRLGQPTNDITKFCFEGAVERIKHTAAYPLLLTLSLCADSASRETLGHATELPELDRDDGLVLLEKLSLVNKHGERFRLLPLTKSYAAAEFDKYPERERLREKWVEYFRRLCKEHESQYWNWNDYPWLQAEGGNILSIVDWAIHNEQGKIALSFLRVVQRYLDIKGHWHEMENYGGQLQAIAEHEKDNDSLAWLSLHLLAWFYVEQEKFEAAQVCIKYSLSLYEKLQDIKGKCFAISNYGRLLRRSEETNPRESIPGEAARKKLEEGMLLAQKNNYRDGIALMHYEFAKLERDLGNWEESKIHWEAAIDWCENPDDEADLDDSFLFVGKANLGWVKYRLGETQEGQRLLEENLSLLEPTGGKGYIITLRLKLAIIEKEVGSPEKARQDLQDVLFHAQRLGMKSELQEAQSLLQELNAEAAESQQKDRNSQNYRTVEL